MAWESGWVGLEGTGRVARWAVLGPGRVDRGAGLGRAWKGLGEWAGGLIIMIVIVIIIITIIMIMIIINYPSKLVNGH